MAQTMDTPQWWRESRRANAPRWWIPGPDPPPPLPEVRAGLERLFDDHEVHLREHAAFGRQFRIPINLRSAEERAWRDAVAWLEARQAAEEEWPWPTRS